MDETEVSISIILSFIIAFTSGLGVGVCYKALSNKNLYRTLYCQSFKQTQQYIDCMNRPLEDTLQEMVKERK